MAVEIPQHQFSICQKANGQFCNINAPLQPIANPPSCITVLYAKMQPVLQLGARYMSGRPKASAYPTQLLQMYGY